MDPLVRRSALTRAFRDPIVPAATPVRETPSVSFADMVRMMAEGIADAQVELDRASAELVTELANTRVNVVPSLTETIGEDGSVKITSGDPVDMSLLELGVEPTFYQFREATVEVAMDLSVVEEVESNSNTRRKALFAGTSRIREERKLNRDVTVSSKLTATLVPVPSPIRLTPARSTIREDEQ